MKVLLYGINFAPERTGIGRYSGEMAAWLAAAGVEVRVICAPPYYPEWRVQEQYRRPSFRQERWEGVDVYRVPLWVPSEPGGIARVLHLMSYAISSTPVALWQVFWRPDVVIGIAPALASAPMAALVAKLSGARSWLHVQDFEVDVAFNMGLLKGGWLRRSVLAVERALLRSFDRVTSISAQMLARLREKGVEPERIGMFPNWADLSHIRPMAATSPYRAELGFAAGDTVALFSGTLGNKQGLMVIPRAAALLRERQDIRFVICGEGPMRAAIEEACIGAPNVTLLPMQPYERLSELLGMADIHLLPQSPEAADLVLPSKLTGMLASGRPVIATCHSGTEIDSVVSRCGLVVPPEDEQRLAAAIVELADDPARRASLGAQARQHAERFVDRDAVLGDLLRDLRGLSTAGSPAH